MRIRSLSSGETIFDTETEPRPTGNGPCAYGKLTLVAGPPGSGKSTYVHKHMKRGDLVVDLDEIFRAITFIEDRDVPQSLLPFGWDARDALFRRMRKHHNVAQIWVIECAPKMMTRHNYRALYDATVVVLEVPEDVCLRRIYANALRSPNKIDWWEIVRKWWRDYEPNSKDEVIKEISDFDRVRQSAAQFSWHKGEKTEQK